MTAPSIELNIAVQLAEVPDLREAVGWSRRADDYPAVLARCLFWAGARGPRGQLVAFAMMIGTGFEHAYLEDVMVHPSQQRHGVGRALVRAMMAEAVQRGVPIVTITHAAAHGSFYASCGFSPCPGAFWVPSSEGVEP